MVEFVLAHHTRARLPNSGMARNGRSAGWIAIPIAEPEPGDGRLFPLLRSSSLWLRMANFLRRRIGFHVAVCDVRSGYFEAISFAVEINLLIRRRAMKSVS
jgi:hypothetical protein